MSWRSRSVREERISFVGRALEEGCNFSRLCGEFGVSRPTGYKWLNRYREVGGFCDLRERSRRPKGSPGRTLPEVEDRVVRLREEYGWGARKLRELLLESGIDLPVLTVHRILVRRGWVFPPEKGYSATRRFERSRPNELWQMDFKGEYRIPGGGHCYPLSLLDDHSRFVVGLHGLASRKGEEVYAGLVRTFGTYGIPEALLMDHGTPWWSGTNGYGLTWLSIQMIRQGIRLLWSGFHHPQTQGKVERFHRTLKAGIRHRGIPSLHSEWEPLLSDFRFEYNHVRPHEALGMKPPASRYEPSQTEYNPDPPEWEYPEGSLVTRLNTQGCLDYHRHRYFVCEALAGERVRIEEIDLHLLVRFRNTFIREIDLQTGQTKPCVIPENEL